MTDRFMSGFMTDRFNNFIDSIIKKLKYIMCMYIYIYNKKIVYRIT
jgi:hypothetical protein